MYVSKQDSFPVNIRSLKNDLLQVKKKPEKSVTNLHYLFPSQCNPTGLMINPYDKHRGTFTMEDGKIYVPSSMFLPTQILLWRFLVPVMKPTLV